MNNDIIRHHRRGGSPWRRQRELNPVVSWTRWVIGESDRRIILRLCATQSKAGYFPALQLGYIQIVIIMFNNTVSSGFVIYVCCE